MANQAETGDVGHGMHNCGALFRRTAGGRPCVVVANAIARNYLSGSFVQGRHGSDRRINPALPGNALLNRGRDHARSQRFGKQKAVARSSPGVCQHALGMNHAGHGVPELHFIIANAVPANHRTASFHHLRQAAGQDPLQNCQVTLLRKADQSQRGQRASPHGVHVTQRISRRDLAESIRIVDNRREEVDRLYQRRISRDLIHAGVVGVIEADQHIRVLLPG